jgi:hypothetical protein
MAKESKEDVALDDEQLNLGLPDDKKSKEVTIEMASDKDNDTSNDDAIADLKRQLQEANSARQNAENKAREYSADASRATNETQNANLQLVNSAIERFNSEQENLKYGYRNAMSAGDHDAAADIQMSISTNAAKLLQLENGRNAMEEQANQPRQPQYQPPGDPVEEFAARLTPRSADWVRRNPQYITDPRLHQKMIAAHNMVLADGHRADTDEYFSAIEDLVRPRRAEQQMEDADSGSALSEAAAPTQRRSAPIAAPVSRSGNAPGIRSNKFTLSPAQREAARISKQTDEEYAKNYLALKNSGKIIN